MSKRKHYTFMNNPRRILFVCGENTCRSPMAETIAKKWIEENYKLENEIIVKSAGVETIPGWFAASHAVTICSPYLDEHASQQVSEKLLGDSDIVFCVSPGYFEGLIRAFGGQAHKIFPLALDGSPVDDPFGRDISEYIRVYQLLETHVHQRMREVYFGEFLN